jgi:hypothetical protein
MPAPICPRCSTRNPVGSAFCRACGTALHTGSKSAAKPKVSIRVVRADGGPEIVVAMGGPQLTCGSRGDIPLEEDPFVAATQARFFFTGSRLAVEDVGGGNGIFLRLHKERELTTGGELRLGRQRLVLEPIPALSAASDGAIIWGSPDDGYRFRLTQILEGGARGEAFLLRDGENLLGRESGDVTFPTDGFVSGRHAILQVRQDRLFVRDLASSNGTFFRLLAPTALDNGDHLLIGRELLRVEVSGR